MYSKLLYKMGNHFLDIQYTNIGQNFREISNPEPGVYPDPDFIIGRIRPKSVSVRIRYHVIQHVRSIIWLLQYIWLHRKQWNFVNNIDDIFLQYSMRKIRLPSNNVPK